MKEKKTRFCIFFEKAQPTLVGWGIFRSPDHPEGGLGSRGRVASSVFTQLITNGHVRAESVATTALQVQCSTTYSSTLPMRPVRVDEKDG